MPEEEIFEMLKFGMTFPLDTRKTYNPRGVAPLERLPSRRHSGEQAGTIILMSRYGES